MEWRNVRPQHVLISTGSICCSARSTLNRELSLFSPVLFCNRWWVIFISNNKNFAFSSLLVIWNVTHSNMLTCVHKFIFEWKHARTESPRLTYTFSNSDFSFRAAFRSVNISGLKRIYIIIWNQTNISKYVFSIRETSPLLK